MAIDDPPLKVAQDIIAAEKRHTGPKLAAKLVGALANFLPGGVSDLVKSALNQDESERLVYLFEILQREFLRTCDRVQLLASNDEEYRRYMHEEYPSLLLDGFRKAGRTRAKSRIARIAAILTNSIQNAKLQSADEIEEFLRIATELSDQDVVVLSQVRKLQGNVITGDGQRLSTKSWQDTDLKELGIGVAEVFSSAPKLENFGLIRQTDEYRRATSSPKPWPYALLPRGDRFLRYIHSQQNEV